MDGSNEIVVAISALAMLVAGLTEVYQRMIRKQISEADALRKDIMRLERRVLHYEDKLGDCRRAYKRMKVIAKKYKKERNQVLIAYKKLKP